MSDRPFKVEQWSKGLRRERSCSALASTAKSPPLSWRMPMKRRLAQCCAITSYQGDSVRALHVGKESMLQSGPGTPDCQGDLSRRKVTLEAQNLARSAAMATMQNTAADPAKLMRSVSLIIEVVLDAVEDAGLDVDEAVARLKPVFRQLKRACKLSTAGAA